MRRLGAEEDYPERIKRASLEELLEALRWRGYGRSDQQPPDGDWTTWLLLGGRGAGKTRAGAEWVTGMALGLEGFAPTPVKQIALVGETLADVRDVMVEGISGLRNIHSGGERPKWIASRRRLQWTNGSVALAFSSEDPESLRGPQFGAAWCDELAKWRYPDATFDMLQFGLRLGTRPRQVVTTTPRPIPLVKRLLADAGTIVTKARTADNEYLAPAFLTQVVARYEGTRLGRQELEAEVIDERAEALWRRDMIEAARVAGAPELRRIVVAIDPPASSGEGADSCGLVAAGIDRDGIGYVLAGRDAGAAFAGALGAARDRPLSSARGRPDHRRGEPGRRDGGGGDPPAGRRACRSSWCGRARGKYLRAEPVAALYEQGQGEARRGVPRARRRDVRFRGTGCPRAGRRTASTRWCGRCGR